MLPHLLRRLFRPAPDPAAVFHSHHYLRHNARRLEHLASLRIPVRGLSVLEVGAGIGDHSHYYLDRGCTLTITDCRSENLRCLRERYPNGDVRVLDLDQPRLEPDMVFDVIHCYGLLYHLERPAEALTFLAAHCSRLLFLETCVSFGQEPALHPVVEDAADPSQARAGRGCRPTRNWVLGELRRHFEWVYLPRTQPNHPEFPLDWTVGSNPDADLSRAVFIASRSLLANDLLAPELLDRQERST